MYRKRVNINFTVDPGVKAALQLWADADNRSLSAQIEFLVRRALFRRGIDPTDFCRLGVIPPMGEPYNLAEYLELAAKRRHYRRYPDGSQDAPSGGQPTDPPIAGPTDETDSTAEPTPTVPEPMPPQSSS